ncbi:MAG TPA: GNAT family N-acetyltransferase, partial [Candidatus Acidoferrales bacterium]|nr:GNAT family N-acetyltransferase [Candidatus Acidoferrales bacterium]
MSELTVELVEDERSLESFREMLRRYQAGLPFELRVHHLEEELLALRQRYVLPASGMFLARVAGVAAGCIVASEFDASTLEIKRLYVEPEFRGSGAGRALMEAAIAFARERSHGRVVLDTERERLRAAYELYCRLGFASCSAYAPAEYPNPTYME